LSVKRQRGDVVGRGCDKRPRAIQDRWRAVSAALNRFAFREAASADGDPAAKEFVSETVGRCMKRVPRLRLRGALKGVDLESESQ